MKENNKNKKLLPWRKKYLRVLRKRFNPVVLMGPAEGLDPWRRRLRYRLCQN
jgi:hypothetical protein